MIKKELTKDMLIGASKGNLIKWEMEDINKNRYYFKTGRRNIDSVGNYGIEPLIELIAFEFGKLMRLNVVKQNLDLVLFKNNNSFELTLVNMSKDFKKQIKGKYLEEFIEYSRLGSYFREFKLNGNSISSRGKALNNLGLVNDGESYLVKLIIYDYIIGNVDRHNMNFGFLLENKNLKLKEAPIFDNGYSFLHDDITKLKNVKSVKSVVDYTNKTPCNNELFPTFTIAEKEVYNYFKNKDYKYELKNLHIHLNIRKQTISNKMKEIHQIYNDLYNKALCYGKAHNIPVKIINLPSVWFENMVEYILIRLEIMKNIISLDEASIEAYKNDF